MPRFKDTRPSLLNAIARGSEAEARQALSQLLKDYWKPLHEFTCSKARTPKDAEDLVQGFCAHLLEKNGLARVDLSRGRLRTWLLASLQNYMSNEADRRNALKAGGGQPLLSLDTADAEDASLHEPTDGLTPERLYEYHWALAFLHNVVGLLREKYVRDGKEALFDKLKPYLMGEPDMAAYQRLSEELGLTPNALKTATFRLRGRYYKLLCEEVERVVGRPEDVEDELRTLLAALDLQS